jgi:uncharacterized protein
MTLDLTGKASAPFHIMVKPTGAICNLDCKYCFYLEKEVLYPDQTNFRMSDEVLENYIRQNINAQPGENVIFSWQGGEPTLLGLDFYRRAIELQQHYGPDKRIENTFQTNGIILNDEWCSFLAEHHFLIGLSIDGPEHLHDQYRLNKGGKGTFKEVMRGLDFLNKNRVEFNTLTVVQRHNSEYPLEVYNFLKEIGSGFMQFIPIVERIASSPDQHGLRLISPDYSGECQVTEWSVEAQQYGQFLSNIFDEWVRHDVARHYVQIFDVALEAWCDMDPSLCIFKDMFIRKINSVILCRFPWLRWFRASSN